MHQLNFDPTSEEFEGFVPDPTKCIGCMVQEYALSQPSLQLFLRNVGTAISSSQQSNMPLFGSRIDVSDEPQLIVSKAREWTVQGTISLCFSGRDYCVKEKPNGITLSDTRPHQ